VPYKNPADQKAYNIRKNLERRITGYLSPTIIENRRRINEIKASVSCVDCGQRFPAICMDFDHQFGPKVEEVSRLLSNGRAWDVLAEEIAKCEIVCANCHRIRSDKAHYNKPRRGAWPTS
jgi:hypothetical protein